VKSSADLDVKMDCVIVAVAHDAFKQMKLEDLARMMNDKPVLIDVKGMFDVEEAERREVCYRRL
jgi:UDP-N-acetyl-D-mannosaminuronate dehydrogenase